MKVRYLMVVEVSLPEGQDKSCALEDGADALDRFVNHPRLREAAGDNVSIHRAQADEMDDFVLNCTNHLLLD